MALSHKKSYIILVIGNVGCFFHCRILRVIMLSLFVRHFIYHSVIPCVYVFQVDTGTQVQRTLKKLFGDHTILSCDNKKNTQLRSTDKFSYFLLSVIQTGFVETLKPQFVPGQVMAGSAAAANLVEEKLSHLQLIQENDNLKSQVN